MKRTNKQNAKELVKDWIANYPDWTDEDTRIVVFDYDGHKWELNWETQPEDLKGLKTALSRGLALVVYESADDVFDTIRGFEWHMARIERAINAVDYELEEELWEAEEVELGIEREKLILSKVTNVDWVINCYKPYFLTKKGVKKYIIPYLTEKFNQLRQSTYARERWERFVENYGKIY